jgi:hypothetical protein
VRNSLHFSSGLWLEEFCFSTPYRGTGQALLETDFVSWPYQPPAIRPISSSGTDKAIYFLLSIAFVSQSIVCRGETSTRASFLLKRAKKSNLLGYEYT